MAELQASVDQEEALFGIWPENWDIVNAFLAVSTQWRAVPLADHRVYFMGLDYTAVQAGFAWSQIALDPEQWAGLRLMERAARDAMNGVPG